MRSLRISGAALFLLLWVQSCSSPKSEAAKKEAEKPLQPLTGRQAFQQMFPGARAWAPDAKPLRLQSINLAEVPAPGGKAGAWECTFVSELQHRSKLWTWSAIEASGNLHQGIFSSSESDWSGPTGQEQPFDIAAIRVDSDAAYNTAMEQKDSKTFSANHPDVKIVYLLEKTPRFPDLAWRVMWGETASTAAYSVFVDATIGKFLQKIE
jgi:hypothetical protein